MVYRSGGCPYCGGEPFHHLSCPFVKGTLMVASAAFAIIVVVFAIARGASDRGVIGLASLFLLYLVALGVWLLASRLKR